MPLLPSINSPEQILTGLKTWQQNINQVLNVPVPPRSPFNFNASGGAAGSVGITLSWENVRGADGYEIQSSTNGDFSASPIIATLTSPAATSWFDSTTVTSVKRYYRIRATAGTSRAQHTVKGIWSAPINATSGSGATTYDQVSNVSGVGGWNKGNVPGIGSRLTTRGLSN